MKSHRIKMFYIVMCLFVCVSVCTFVSAQSSSYFYAGSKSLVIKGDDGSVAYLFQDRLGSDTHTKSLPFGQIIHQADRFGFTGKERDSTGLHYFAARYYDSSIGRFTRIDPVPSEPTYQYVGNNPLNFVDPTGHKRIGSLEDNPYIVAQFTTGDYQILFYGAPSVDRISGKLTTPGSVETLAIRFIYLTSQGTIYGPRYDRKTGSKTTKHMTGAEFGNAIRSYLAPGARIMFAIVSEEESSLSNLGFFEQVREAIGGDVTIDVSFGNRYIRLGDDKKLRFDIHPHSDGLYTAKKISTIEQWDASISDPQNVIAVPNPDVSDPDYQYIITYHRNFIKMGGHGGTGRIIRSDHIQWEYYQQIKQKYLTNNNVFVFRPTQNLNDPNAFFLDTSIFFDVFEEYNKGWRIDGYSTGTGIRGVKPIE